MKQQLAKSLHTVSVLVNVTKFVMDNYEDEATGLAFSVDMAMDVALVILKLNDKEDTYKLVDAAKRQLTK